MNAENIPAPWSNEQWKVITTLDSNLLVSAAAGAGKTAVLVERICRLISNTADRLDIDRLLVVTFTEAAAAEMRERIGNRLEKNIAENNHPHLWRQLDLLNGANISTLHSFCLEVIGQYFYLIDLDPVFRVADESEATLLQKETLEELVEDLLSANKSNINSLVGSFGGTHGHQGLTDTILLLYKFACSSPDPLQWLEQTAEAFNISEGNSLEQWQKPVREHLQEELSYIINTYDQALDILSLPGAPAEYEDILSEEQEMFTSLLSEEYISWETFADSWREINFKRMPAACKECDPQLKELASKLRDKAKDIIRKNQQRYFSRTEAQLTAEIQNLYPLIKSLTENTREFFRRYEKAKAKKGVLDFNDLEHLCLKILTTGGAGQSPAVIELQKRFEFVLVDEYQDINPVQNMILNLVSRQESQTPNLFMVGDIKQSIYRFRLAEPALFLERLHDKDSRQFTVHLSRNFRCRDTVVDAVNYLFAQLMTEEVAELAYNEDAKLVYGASFPQNTQHGDNYQVEVHLIEKENLNSGNKEEADLLALEKEGAVIAAKIKEMTSSGPESSPLQIFDKEIKRYRQASFGDIVILMRATSGRANLLVDLFKKFDIPASAELSTGFFNAVEVETILSLLKVIDNPCQDIPLAALLRSPLVGLNTAELASIRGGTKNGDFYTAVKTVAVENSPLAERLQWFQRTLKRWRSLAQRKKVSSLIAHLYRESGYFDYVAGLPDGKQRQANLRALFARACSFDNSSGRGLSGFMQFIKNLRESGEDLGSAKPQGENENVVRIISIHKSKGLEFPIVFLSDIGKNFNMKDTQGSLLLHRELGLGPLITDRERLVRYPSLPYQAIRIRLEKEAIAEEIRILYVAMTRAKEKLFLVGSVKDLGNEQEKWQQTAQTCGNKFPVAEFRRARSYLQWVGLSLAIQESKGEKCISCFTWGGEKGASLPAIPQKTIQDGANNDMLLLRPIENDSAVSQTMEAEISAALKYKYPYRYLSKIPFKIPAAEIKSHLDCAADAADEETNNERWSRPSFLRKEIISPAEKGTLYHLVMQYLDLNLPLDSPGIQQQIDEMAAKKIIPPELCRHLSPAAISSFFTSAAGQQALAHRHTIYREWDFTLTLSAQHFSDEEGKPVQNGERIIVQGVIDMLFKTKAGYTIVDYKTGRAMTQKEAENSFRHQLSVYAGAVSSILGEQVCSAYLYFFTGKRLLALTDLNLFKQ